jgi:hypothetical protein
MDRRTALTAVATLCGYLYGKPVVAQSGQVMLLALDGVDVIEVRYRGQRVFVNPAEVVAALQPTSPYPMQQQMPKR